MKHIHLLLVAFALSSGSLLAQTTVAVQGSLKKTTDRIEKLTWILIAIIVVLSIFSARMISHRQSAGTVSAVDTEQVQQQEAARQQGQPQPVIPAE